MRDTTRKIDPRGKRKSERKHEEAREIRPECKNSETQTIMEIVIKFAVIIQFRGVFPFYVEISVDHSLMTKIEES